MNTRFSVAQALAKDVSTHCVEVTVTLLTLLALNAILIAPLSSFIARIF